MVDITNPHDKFFREVWSRKEIAADFLANYLPQDVRQHLYLDKLEIQKDSFIEEDLKEQFSDVLYRVEVAGGGGGFVYVLFEHKSYPDHFVAVQLLRYMSAIWHQHLKNKSTRYRNKSSQLPLIVPLLLYHGAENWQPRSLGELIESVPESLTPYIPNFSFAFSNFAASVSPEFRGDALLRAILRLLHTIPGGDLRKELNQVMVLLKGIVDDPTGKSIFRTIIEYIYAAQEEVTPEDVGSMARNQISTTAEDEAMTVAEKLRKEGMQVGEKKGKQEGIEKGIREDIHEILNEQLGEVPQDIVDQLEDIREVDALRRLLRSALHAESADDFRQHLSSGG